MFWQRAQFSAMNGPPHGRRAVQETRDHFLARAGSPSSSTVFGRATCIVCVSTSRPTPIRRRRPVAGSDRVVRQRAHARLEVRGPGGRFVRALRRFDPALARQAQREQLRDQSPRQHIARLVDAGGMGDEREPGGEPSVEANRHAQRRTETHRGNLLVVRLWTLRRVVDQVVFPVLVTAESGRDGDHVGERADFEPALAYRRAWTPSGSTTEPPWRRGGSHAWRRRRSGRTSLSCCAAPVSPRASRRAARGWRRAPSVRRSIALLGSLWCDSASAT